MITIMLASRRNENLQTLVKSLGVDIDHLETLNAALTHNSFNKKKKESTVNVNVNVSEFQRLEFFGDSILKFVMSEFLIVFFITSSISLYKIRELRYIGL